MSANEHGASSGHDGIGRGRDDRAEDRPANVHPVHHPSELDGLPSAPLGLALPAPAAEPPMGPGWLAEAKNDGYRLAIEISGESVRCLSRAGREITSRYRWLADLASRFPTDDVLVDGEAVAYDESGQADFGLLQKALAEDVSRITYIAFDLLRLNGHDLTELPTMARKELLETLVSTLHQDEKPVIVCARYTTDAEEFFRCACDSGAESVIFKRADARYRPGKTRDWLEVKCEPR